MNLSDSAYTVDELGKPQLVVEDGPLMERAAGNRISPGAAQMEALRNGIIPLRYLKNFWALSLPEQIRICESKVLICGCGGLGGILVQLLSRAGVGHLRLVDGDSFASSNLNRQLLCDTDELSRPKAQVAKERAQTINPLIEVEAFLSVLDEQNAEQLIRGMDLVLDALDNLQGRFVISEAAHRLKIPFIHAAATGWWGQISTFLAESSGNLASIYGERRSRNATEISLGVLGPTPAVIGSLEAMEAIRILSGRKPAYADQLLYFDGETGRTEVLPL